MKYFVECDACNTLGQVNLHEGFASQSAVPRGWYQFLGPFPKLSLGGSAPKDICGDCAVEIIRERMSASEWEPNEDSG